jgi:uncharacterized protein YdaU (DUF1376 family)
MVDFYRHNIAKWRGGTGSLTHEQYRAYHVIVEEIMLQEGPIVPHERMLSGTANMSVRAFRAALERLIEVGKLVLKDGRIGNSRALFELEFVKTNRENAAKGGESSGKSRRDARDRKGIINRINDLPEAALRSKTNIREESRVEEKRGESLRTSAREARQRSRLPPDWRPDPDERRIARDAGLTDPEIDALAAEYADYWSGVKGEKGQKADWPATWRNRIADVAARRKLRVPVRPPPRPDHELWDRGL